MSDPNPMTLDFAALQGYVDDELDDADAREVAKLLESSAEARRFVQSQSEVRALLRRGGALEIPPARTAALRTRVLAALDEIDAQDQESELAATRSESSPAPAASTIVAANHNGALSGALSGARAGLTEVAAVAAATSSDASGPPHGPTNVVPLVPRRSPAALLRRVAPFLPAAAAALALFVITRGAGTGAEVGTSLAAARPNAAVDATHLRADGSSRAATEGAAADTVDLSSRARVPTSPRGFLTARAGDGGDLPAGVELVSADGGGGETHGTLEFVDHLRGETVLDQLSPARFTKPRGTPFRTSDGTIVYVRRDEIGRPVVEFERGGLRHTLRYVGGARQLHALDGMAGAALDPSADPDVAALSALAMAMRTARGARQAPAR